MKEYLVLSGIGPDKPGIAKAISEVAYTKGCSIEDSRMAVLGGEFAILVLLEGEKKEIETFTSGLRDLELETGLTLSARKTKARPKYQVEKGETLETEAHHAPVTGTPMFRMTITAEKPAEVPVRKLREELATLCDRLNMDFTLEALA